MKPTKKQKLRWIRNVMNDLHQWGNAMTCLLFGYEGTGAGAWYASVLRRMGKRPSRNLFDAFKITQKRCDARILWLSFLHHWVSTGEVE